MSGTSAGGVDGGEPHLTTNGEVSIASEFNYDAGKYGSNDQAEGAKAAAQATSSATVQSYHQQCAAAASPVEEHYVYLSPGSINNASILHSSKPSEMKQSCD